MLHFCVRAFISAHLFFYALASSFASASVSGEAQPENTCFPFVFAYGEEAVALRSACPLDRVGDVVGRKGDGALPVEDVLFQGKIK